MKLCKDIHGPHRMNPTDFGDPLTFHLAASSGQIFNLYKQYSAVFWFLCKTIPTSLSCTVFNAK